MGNPVFRYIAKGILGRLVAYGFLALGFLLLYQGFQSGSLGTGVPLGLVGGAAILMGMYLMVTGRRGEPPMITSDPSGPDDKEDDTVDPIDGSNQGA